MGGDGGLFHIRLNPSHYKNPFGKQTFVWPKSKAGGSSVCLPRLSTLLFLTPPHTPVPHLDTTLNKTGKDLIPSHFPQEEYIQLQQPIVWIMIKGEVGGGGGQKSHGEKHSVKEEIEQQPRVSKDAEHG